MTLTEKPRRSFRFPRFNEVFPWILITSAVLMLVCLIGLLFEQYLLISRVVGCQRKRVAF